MNQKHPNHRHNRRAARSLGRIEHKLNELSTVLCHLTQRINIIEQQQRGKFYDEALTKLQESADRMKDLAMMESQIIRERYGKTGI